MPSERTSRSLYSGRFNPVMVTCTVSRLLTTKRLSLIQNMIANEPHTYLYTTVRLMVIDNRSRYISKYQPIPYLKNPSVSYLAVGDDDLAKSGAELELRRKTKGTTGNSRRLSAVLLSFPFRHSIDMPRDTKGVCNPCRRLRRKVSSTATYPN
jgi:hypothetical protein